MSKITIWNQRQIIAKLDRHPELLHRYGIDQIYSNYILNFSQLSSFVPCTILFLSDQSLMAHNLASALRHSGFEIVFLPFWNYCDPFRLKLMLGSMDESSIGLVILFLGDSFGITIPTLLIDFILQCHRIGVPLLLYPFVAWVMRRDFLGALAEICPVELIDPRETARDSLNPRQILGDFRRGDFRWLVDFDSFAEDHYVEYDPQNATNIFTNGIATRFGLSHSFEYLKPRPGAEIALADTTGNPFVVIKQSKIGKICYVNTCCHGCMSSIAISSPLESSKEFGTLQCNIIKWLLTK